MAGIEIDAALRIREVDREIRKLNQDIRASRISALNIPTLLDTTGFKRELIRLRREAIQSAIAVPIRAKLDIPDNVAVAVKFDSVITKQIDIASQNLTKNITEAISTGFKQATSGNIFTSIFKGIAGFGMSLFGGITSTLGSLISGAVIGLTLPLGQKLGKGLTEGVESELRDVVGSFDLVGRTIGSGLVDELLTALNADLKSLRSVFESFVPSLQITTEAAAGRGDRGQRDRERIKSAERQFAAEQQRLKKQERLFRAKEQALRDTEASIAELSNQITQKIADFEASAGLPALVNSFQEGVNKLTSRSQLLQQKLAVPESLRSDRDNKAIELLNKQIKDASRDIQIAQAGIEAIDRQVGEQFADELNNLSNLISLYNKALNKFETELGRIDEINATKKIRSDANRGKLVDFSQDDLRSTKSDAPKNVQPFDELVELYEKIQQAETELKTKNLKGRRLADKKEEFQLEVDLRRKQESRVKLLKSLIQSQDVVSQASPDKFRELATLIFELSNIDPGQGLEELPDLVLPGGSLLEQLLTTDTLAAFSEQLNSLVVDPNLFLAFNEQLELTNREAIEGVGLTVREIRKQITSSFNGKNIKELSVADLPETLLQATQEELNLIADQVERLAKSASSQGIDPEVARAIEQDALLFELRFTEAIAKQIGLLTDDFNIDNFNEDVTAKLSADSNQQLRAIFQTLAEASGLSFDAIADSLSNVVLPETEKLQNLIASRASARFDAVTNQILLRPATFEELAKGGLDLTSLEAETIAHEIRHAFQTGFGKLTPEELNAGQFGVELLKATKAEMRLIEADIEKSVASAVKAGSSLSEETIRALEEDAYVFQLRAGKLVKQTLSGLTSLSPTIETSDLPDSKEIATAVEQNINKVKNAYQIIFEEVIKASDIGEELELLIGSLPELKSISAERIAENPDIQGAYDRLFNKISLRPEDIQKLQAGLVDFDLVSFLSHELRHALEQMFGTISDADFRGGEAGVQLLQATKEEFAQFYEGFITSVNNADPARQDIAKTLEEDAYTFQLRFSESIFNAVRSRLEELNRQVNVKPTLKERDSRSSEEIKTAVENVENNITNAQRIYEEVFRLVAEASEFTLYDFDRPPELNPKALPSGIKGQYTAESNSVNISPKVLEDLDFNLVSQEIVDVLVHEIRHAFQSELGNIDAADKLAGQFGIDLIEPTVDEFAQISEQVNKSVTETLESLKQAGVSDKALADIRPILEQTEIDAYTFSLRLHEKIYQSLQQSLRPELIDLGDLNQLSQEEIIELFNSPEFSSQGLKELVKRIGISANVYQSATKQELAQILANQTERGKGDEIRTVANSLGDRLKNKDYQTGAVPQLPTIDEQAYIKRLQEASQNVNEIISLLQSNPPQTLKELNKYLQNLAKELIARKNEISQVTSINDISGKSSQVIAGYKGRFQELALSLLDAIAVNNNQTIEFGLSQLIELEKELKSSSFTESRDLISVGIPSENVSRQIGEIDKQILALQSNSGDKAREQIDELNQLAQIVRAKEEIDSALSYLSSADASDAIKEFSNLESQIKQDIKSVSALDNSDLAKEVKAQLQQQLKAVKTAKKLALLDVEFQFDELLKNPQEYLQILKDSTIALTKDKIATSAKKAGQSAIVAISSAVENIIADAKDAVIAQLQAVERFALPETTGKQKALPGAGNLISGSESATLTNQSLDTIAAILVRAAADIANSSKSTLEKAQATEKLILDLNPLLKVAKIGIQTSVPIAAAGAAAGVSPELAAILNGLSGELANALLPLARHFTLFGFGAEKLAEAASYFAVFGSAGSAGIKTIQAGAEKIKDKAFELAPEKLQQRLTPESQKAFENIVALRQKEIKAIAAGLEDEIKNGGSTQKLLTGYQEITEQISQLEQFINNSDLEILKKTRDRLEDLKALQNKIASTINATKDSFKQQVEKVFEVEITPVDDSDFNKSTLKAAIALYKDAIIKYRQDLEQKILEGKAVDSDFQAGEELAKRGQALAATLKNQGGFSKEARSLSGVSQTLLNKTDVLDNEAIVAGEDVINGILEGTNQKLAEVFIQGRSLGIELLRGFKNELDIKSPSGEFERVMTDVAQGIVDGHKKERSRIRQTGEDIGQELLDGTELTPEDYEKAVARLEDFVARKAELLAQATPNTKTKKALLKAYDEELDKVAEIAAAYQEVSEEFSDNVIIPARQAVKVDDLKETDLDPEPSSQNLSLFPTLDEAEATFGGDLGDALPDLEVAEVETQGFFDRLKQRITDAKSAFTNLFTRNVDSSELDSAFNNAVDSAEQAIANIEANLAVVDRAVDNSERQLEQANEAVSDSVNQLGNETETIGSKIKRLVKIGLKEFNNLEGVTKKVTGAFKFLAAGILAVKAIEFLQDKFSQFTETLEETILRFDDLKTALLFVNDRDLEKTESQLKFLRKEADRLKVSFLDAAEGFKAVAGAARDTDLEGLTKQIFTSVSQAARVLQLDNETVKGTFKALNDIIGKGVVQAEEIRGQLGDRIPGAMQIAARAMGTTTQELSKLIETGQVASEDFIPKFIAQLEAETRSGLQDATDSLSASIVDLENKIVDLQLAIGEALGFAENKSKGIKIAVLALDALSLAIKVVAKAVPVLVLAAKGLIGLGLIKFLRMAKVQAISLGNSIKTLALNFNAGAASSMKLKRALVQLRRIGRTLRTLFKGFIVVEAISVAIDTFNRLKDGIKEAKEGLDEIKQSYLDFQKAIVENNPENEFLITDIVKQNIEQIKENRNWYMKLADASKQWLSSEKTGSLSQSKQLELAERRRKILGKTFSEAQIEQASARLIKSIAEANSNLSNLSIDIGVNLQEVETDNIREAIALTTRTIAGLETQTATTVEEQEDLNAAIALQKERATELNKELERRFGLEKSLAKIVLNRNRINTAATEAESNAIARIDEETLASGDLNRDVELLKLRETEKRIKTQYDNELNSFDQYQKAIAKRNQDSFNKDKAKIDKEYKQKLLTEKSYQEAIAELQENYLGNDIDTGLPKNLVDEEIKKYQELRDGVRVIRTEMMENSLAIAQAEIDAQLGIYEDYLEEIENKIQKAEDKLIQAEKERLIEIQRLVNDDLIDTESAEELKTNLTRDRITSELKQEKKKLRALKRFRTDEEEVRKQNDENIKASRTKILDLTLQLLEQEKQAEEKTMEAIATARDNAFSQLESRLSRLQQIYQTEAQLISDRATADEKLADLQLAKLRQALELRKQINSGDLDPGERRTAIRQLVSLGIKGRTDELSLLDKIEDKERQLAKDKLKNLELQQVYARQQLEIETQQLIIATKKAQIESDKAQLAAEKEVNSAETAIAKAEGAIAKAETDEELERANEELDRANKLYDLAVESLDLANKDVDLSQQQLDNLDNIIAKKEENLALTQAIARAELEGTTIDEQFEREKARNEAFERRDRRFAATLTGKKRERILAPYLSDDEYIESKIQERKEKVEEKGDEWSQEDEEKLRAKLQTTNYKLQTRQERAIKNPTSFTIEAPPEILEAIRQGKPFTVPAVPQFKTPLELDIFGQTKTKNEGDRILKTLQNIEQKFKQPVIINNDNQFVNQYDKSSTDEIPRLVRSEMVDMMNTIENRLNY